MKFYEGTVANTPNRKPFCEAGSGSANLGGRTGAVNHSQLYTSVLPSIFLEDIVGLIKRLAVLSMGYKKRSGEEGGRNGGRADRCRRAGLFAERSGVVGYGGSWKAETPKQTSKHILTRNSKTCFQSSESARPLRS